MTRWTCAIVSLILAACGTSPDVHYKNGRLLLKQLKKDEAMREAEAGFAAEPSWRFRILKAEVLLARFDAKGAKALLAFPEPPSDPESLARQRMDEGWAEFIGSNYSKAATLLQQASEIAKPAGLPAVEAMIENRMGLIEMRQARMEEAERAFRHVIEATPTHHDPYLEATAMGNLGYLFLNGFQLEEAIYWFEKASVLFQQVGNTDSYYVLAGNLGSCYQRLGDSDKALEYYRRAEVHARENDDHQSEQRWIGNSGEVLYERGDLPRAAEKFRQALAIAQSRDYQDSASWWQYNLASVSIDLGDFDAAEKWNQQALTARQAIADHSDYYPLVNQAHIAAGRKNSDTEALYRKLIDEYHQGMDPIPILEARAGLALWLAESGHPDQADAEFRGALEHVENRRTALASVDNRMIYLAKLIYFYDRYINFLVDRGQTERALEVAESSRARVLDERMGATSPHSAVPAARLRELARASHSVFFSYWLGKKRSFLWAVTPKEITRYELPPESQIAPLVAGYRSFIEKLRDPLRSEYPARTKLSAMLLDPVRPLLASSSRVVLVPDRSLHALNFETLADPENPSKYLIERVTLEVAPSLDVLADRGVLPARTASPADSLLLIGDPEQAVEEYPRLPFAANEIEMISKTFSPQRQTIRKGADAYPAAYRDAHPGQFSWIHFATHAAANQNSPLDSALILSRHDNAYQLSAREVMNVPLNASLVALSACRSAGAKTYSGEGQVGLSWAFLRAGARSVVAGLWDVTDRSTALLMADFYDQLAHNIPPAEALRHAKLTLLHGGGPYQKPFYWGPFQLYAGTI